ncbi:MAG TPA: lmo0937 family membrane protein [Vicinamibacterales bacterium]|nr:lmo0937 family membrane protein [Vicinamibacterales bacterium]
MAVTAFDKFSCECAGVRRVVDDAFQQAAHVAHKARVLKTVAADALEARVVETAHRIRKDPFTSVGIAFAIGVPVDAFLGWVFSHSGTGEGATAIGSADRHPPHLTRAAFAARRRSDTPVLERTHTRRPVKHDGCVGVINRLRPCDGWIGDESDVKGRIAMLYTIAVILLIAWLLGLVGTFTIGPIVHVLLVVAIVLFVVGLLSGRRTLA